MLNMECEWIASTSGTCGADDEMSLREQDIKFRIRFRPNIDYLIKYCGSMYLIPCPSVERSHP